jgi:hypothetical protein
MATTDLSVRLTEDQIRRAVQNIVEEEMPDAVRSAIRSHADTVIKEAVRARIGPVVDAMLASEQFVTGRWDDHKTPLDTLVKRAVSNYLDERVSVFQNQRSSIRTIQQIFKQ